MHHFGAPRLLVIIIVIVRLGLKQRPVQGHFDFGFLVIGALDVRLKGHLAIF